MRKLNAIPFVWESEGGISAPVAKPRITVSEAAGIGYVTYSFYDNEIKNNGVCGVLLGRIRFSTLTGSYSAESLAGIVTEKRFESIFEAGCWLMEKHLKNLEARANYFKLMSAPAR